MSNLNVSAARAQAIENDDGTWNVTFRLQREAAMALLLAAPMLGNQVYLVLNKPPTQSIAPAGAESVAFGAPATAMPPAAREARLLCDNPQFQEYAILKDGIPLAEVTNALETALRFLLKRVGAETPADFEKGEVQKRFAELKTEFEAR